MRNLKCACLLLFFSIAQNSAMSPGLKLLAEIALNNIDTAIPSIINLTSGQCRDDLERLYHDARDGKLWAMKMLDANAKPSAGILEGNIINFGDFDQCLSIEYTYKSMYRKETPFLNTSTETSTSTTLTDSYTFNENNGKGKYCLGSLSFTASAYNLSFPQNMLPKHWDADAKQKLLEAVHKYSAVGLCIPSSCNRTNLDALLSYIEEMDYFIAVDFQDELCATKDATPLTAKHKIGLAIFSLILLIITVSTIYEYVFNTTKPSLSTVFSSFSLITNASKLFTLQEPKANHIKCLQGLKVLSIFWIIMGHSFMFWSATATNMFQIDKWSQQLRSNFIQAAYYSVETFFAVSGILSGYIFCRGSFVHDFTWGLIPKMYLHRFLRIAPALYAMIIFYVTLGDRIGMGPYKLMLNHMETINCEDKLLAELFFVQNYYKSTADCIGTGQTWYLANEMQLFLLLPFLVMVLKLRVKFFHLVVFGFISTSIFATFFAVYFMELPITFEELVIHDKYFDFHKFYYYPLHTRMSSWFVGLLLGHWMSEKSYDQLVLKRKEVFGAWTLWTLIISLLFVSQGHMKVTDWGMGTIALYQALSRPVFAMCICWIVFACNKGYAGIIDWFLSLKLFNFFGKINYSMYLVHQLIIVFYMGVQRTPHYFINTIGFFEFSANLMQTICLAIIWTMAFEMPIYSLEKCVFKKRNRVENNRILLQ